MKLRLLARWTFTLAAAAPWAPAAMAVEVQVMISAGFHGVYSQLGPAFERATGHKLVTTRGPSMGDSPEAIPTRLGRGEVAELIHVPGVTYVGPIPAELQPGQSFAGAITSTAKNPQAAAELLRFLASPEAAPVITKAGLTPIPAR